MIVYGMPTTGKTTVAAQVREAGFPTLDTDEILHAMARLVTGQEKIPREFWEDVRNKDISRTLKDAVAKYVAQIDQPGLAIFTNLRMDKEPDLAFTRSGQDLSESMKKRDFEDGKNISEDYYRKIATWKPLHKGTELGFGEFIDPQVVLEKLGVPRPPALDDNQILAEHLKAHSASGPAVGGDI